MMMMKTAREDCCIEYKRGSRLEQTAPHKSSCMILFYFICIVFLLILSFECNK